MADLEKALATQLANIEKRTGKSLDELINIVNSSELSKHGELVAMLKSTLGMGHGDANTMVHVARQSVQPNVAESGSPEQILETLYTGKKSLLQPIHRQLLKEMGLLGDFEAAPKKTYVSYRAKKQFCTIGPATNTEVEIGLNVKDLQSHARLKVLPAGQMCNYKVRLAAVNEIDSELIGWIKAAYMSAK